MEVVKVGETTFVDGYNRKTGGWSYLWLRKNKPFIFADLKAGLDYLKNLEVCEMAKTREEKIDYLVGKLDISLKDAEELLDFDYKVDKGIKDIEGETKVEKPAAPKKKKSVGIQDADLDFIMETIRANFADKSFQNKDLAPLVAEKFTARQTPSRLKKLAEAGKLVDKGGSPKSYALA